MIESNINGSFARESNWEGQCVIDGNVDGRLVMVDMGVSLIYSFLSHSVRKIML